MAVFGHSSSPRPEWARHYGPHQRLDSCFSTVPPNSWLYILGVLCAVLEARMGVWETVREKFGDGFLQRMIASLSKAFLSNLLGSNIMA